MNATSWSQRLYGWALRYLYNELAGCYDLVAWVVSGGRWGRWRRFALDYIQGPAVLELGSGPGRLLIEGASRGYGMVGVDLSPSMVRRARERAGSAGGLVPNGDVQVVQGRGEQLPFDRASFDCVVATFPAAYVLDLSTLLECRRVLRGSAAEIVLVGLWVSTTLPGLRSLPVFFGEPSAATLARIRNRMADAGLRVDFREHLDGPFRIGVAIAQAISQDESAHTLADSSVQRG